MLFWYYLTAAVILAIWYALYRAWHRRVDADIRDGASFEYERLQRQDPELIGGTSEEDFRTIYARVESPQGPLHVFAAVAIFLAGAPFVLALNTFVIRLMENTGVIPQPAEQAQRLRMTSEGIRLIGGADLTTLQYILEGWGGFFSFFSLLAFWVLIFFFTMRRYHSRRAGSLREEVLRSR